MDYKILLIVKTILTNAQQSRDVEIKVLDYSSLDKAEKALAELQRARISDDSLDVKIVPLW